MTTATLIVGESKAMRDLFDVLPRVAETEHTVILRGETGTGKELVARRIHELSPRHGAPFEAINVGALSEQLFESTLFGHERGAFTGAVRRHEGKVRRAEGGTLFLDEIGDVAPATQVKLLRLLQEKEYEPLGGTSTLKANVRLIAATHRDLEQMVSSELFRSDLYYRLKVARLTVPSLRERRDDIPLLVHHFLDKNSVRRTRLDDEVLGLLAGYDWPGNVRQLENFVAHLIILTAAGDVPADLVRQELREEAGAFRPVTVSGRGDSDAGTVVTAPAFDESLERPLRCIVAALDVLLLAGDVSQAARAAHLWTSANRGTLVELRKRHVDICRDVLENTSHEERPVDLLETNAAAFIAAFAGALHHGCDVPDHGSPRSPTAPTAKEATNLLSAAAQVIAPANGKIAYLAAILELESREMWPRTGPWLTARETAGAAVTPRRQGPGVPAVYAMIRVAREAVHGIEEGESAPEPHATVTSHVIPEDLLNPAQWSWTRRDVPHIGVDDTLQVRSALRAWREGTVRYNAAQTLIDRLPSSSDSPGVHWSRGRFLSCSDEEGIRIGVNVLLQVGEDMIIQNRDPTRVAVAPGQLAAAAGGTFALTPTAPLALHEAALGELRRELWNDIPVAASDLEFIGAFANEKRRVVELAFIARLGEEKLSVLDAYCREDFSKQQERFESMRDPRDQGERTKVPPYFRIPTSLLRQHGSDAFGRLPELPRERILLGNTSSVSEDAIAALAERPAGVVLKGALELWLRHER